MKNEKIIKSMKIVCFVEDENKKGVFRFVKSFRRKGLFRKARVEYSLIDVEAYHFDDDEGIPAFIEDRIKKDYPSARVFIWDLDHFVEFYRRNRFFVIARQNEEGEEYYYGKDRISGALYTKDMSEVRFMLSASSAAETMRTIQKTSKDKVFVRTLYLNLVNELLRPCMMITCTHKGSQETKYFSRLDGNRVRRVSTSFSAAKFEYEEALRTFEWLHTHNKNYLYAVLPVFKDNVHCKDIESYMRENKVSRMVAMDLQLKYLNR